MKKLVWKQSKTVKGMYVAKGKKYIYGYSEDLKMILIDAGEMRVTLKVVNLNSAQMIAQLLEKT